jgi:hypothetical protein
MVTMCYKHVIPTGFEEMESLQENPPGLSAEAQRAQENDREGEIHDLHLSDLLITIIVHDKWWSECILTK